MLAAPALSPRLHPVFEENKVVNMISVCLDTTLTTTCEKPLWLTSIRRASGGNRAYLVNKMGKVAHRFRLFMGAVPATPAEEIKVGGTLVGTPAFRSAPRTTPFLSDQATSTGAIRHLLR
jgi:hypothetical protein